MSESTALTNIEEQLRRELAQLSNHVEPPSSNKISTRNKLFHLPNGQSSPGPLQAVILDYIAVNMVYKGVYNPNVKSPPLCWALGKNIKELKPSASVPTPQSIDCASCPKNQWGSGQNGTGRLCKNQRRLLIIPPDLKGEPQTLYVSPGGLRQWDNYLRGLAAEHGKVPIQVVTEISFDPNQAYPTLLFNFVEYNPNVEEAVRLRMKYQEMLLREPDVKAEAA